MKRIDWFVARRYLSSTRKGRFGSFSTIISVLGIAVGVMALLLVVAVMTGLQTDLTSKILASTPHIYVSDPNTTGFRVGDWQNRLDMVRKTPGVIAAEPLVEAQVVLAKRSDPKYARGGLLKGIDPLSSPLPLTELEKQVRNGTVSWAKPASGLPGALVGSRLAARLSLFPGDTIFMMSVENMEISDVLAMPTPRQGLFEVIGTFETGMFEYDEMNVYANLTDVQTYIGFTPDTISMINVNVQDAWAVQTVADSVQARLGIRPQTWLDLNGPLLGALNLEKLAMSVILFLIILVASFNIMSTLMMLVTEKTREIGIMKSMGMTDGSVMRIFMTQGLLIGLVGTVLGLVGGMLIMWVVTRFELIELPAQVYFIDKLPLTLHFFDAAMIVIASLAIAFLSTIYPARKAAKLVPVDAIRHD